MLVIFPFEEDLYKEAGVDCAYVGHPLLDHAASFTATGMYQGDCVIGLLPGSREQEIGRLLPAMLGVAESIRRAHPEARFIAPCVDEARQAQVRAMAGSFPLEMHMGSTFEVLHAARFCLVASGTATLETALFQVPMIILYKVSGLSYWIARRLVRIEHIGLVNILAGAGIVPEFIQERARPELITPTALELIEDSPARETMRRDLAEVREKLGEPGASRRAALEVRAIAKEA